MFAATHLAGFAVNAQEPGWSTIFQQTLNTDSYNTFWGSTIRQLIPASLFTPLGGISKIRITFQSGATYPFKVDNGIRIQEKGAGDVYDFSTTPVSITHSTGTAAWNIATGSNLLTSDEITFALDTSKDYVWSFDTGGDAGVNFGAKGLVTLTGARTFSLGSSDGATVDTSGYTERTGAQGALCAIQKIEGYA